MQVTRDPHGNAVDPAVFTPATVRSCRWKDVAITRHGQLFTAQIADINVDVVTAYPTRATQLTETAHVRVTLQPQRARAFVFAPSLGLDVLAGLHAASGDTWSVDFPAPRKQPMHPFTPIYRVEPGASLLVTKLP